jgi:hypothetical protein
MVVAPSAAIRLAIAMLIPPEEAVLSLSRKR